MGSSLRPPLYLRAALLLVTLLSIVLLGEMQSVSCDMHGLGAARGDAMSGHATPEHGGMAGMSHHGGAPASGGEDGSCACTCIGACTMVAPLATTPTATTLLVAFVDPEPRRPLDVEPVWSPPVAPDRLLPFANGPPHSAALL